ncbi:MAG: transcription antitermination factor NusB [Alphaproteobacteria bacterium]|nr:transcription antitermination factor NusB [Alphaproteobacteria bacterium]
MTENKTQKFTNARLNAVQALYASAFSDEPIEKTVYQFLNKEIGTRILEEDEDGDERFIPLADADSVLFTALVKEVGDKKEQLDEIITSSLSEDWEEDRMEFLLRTILRVGLAEFFVQPNLDAPIIINEYVDMTRSFYDGPEIQLVNAVLDKFSKVIRGI